MDTRPAQNAEAIKNGMMIRIISAEGQIEESAGRRRFCLIPDGMFMNYEKKMLCCSGCPHTLPMYFLSIDGTETVYYDFTGLIRLEDHIKRRSDDDLPGRENQIYDALDVLSKILESIKGMESYMLFPERFSIHPDTIFLHPDGRAAFAFFPNENPDMTLQDRIIALIENLIRLYRNADTEQYLSKYKDLIHTKNPGLDGMISILGTLKREVSYIYWNTKNFRRLEGNESFPEYEKTGWNRKEEKAFMKPLAVQAGFAAGLTAVYLSGTLEFTSFAGLAVLTAGADLWIMRKLYYKINARKSIKEEIE